MKHDTDSKYNSKQIFYFSTFLDNQKNNKQHKKSLSKPDKISNISYSDIQKLLAKCVFCTGSIAKLAKLSGISKSTLRRIADEKHRTNLATILRLTAFLDCQTTRRGPPLKKGGK